MLSRLWYGSERLLSRLRPLSKLLWTRSIRVFGYPHILVGSSSHPANLLLKVNSIDSIFEQRIRFSPKTWTREAWHTFATLPFWSFGTPSTSTVPQPIIGNHGAIEFSFTRCNNLVLALNLLNGTFSLKRLTPRRCSVCRSSQGSRTPRGLPCETYQAPRQAAPTSHREGH